MDPKVMEDFFRWLQYGRNSAGYLPGMTEGPKPQDVPPETWQAIQDWVRSQTNQHAQLGAWGENTGTMDPATLEGTTIRSAPNQWLKNLKLAMGENFGNVMDRSNAAAGPGDVVGTWMLKSFLKDNPQLNWLQTGGPSQKWD